MSPIAKYIRKSLYDVQKFSALSLLGPVQPMDAFGCMSCDVQTLTSCQQDRKTTYTYMLTEDMHRGLPFTIQVS